MKFMKSALTWVVGSCEELLTTALACSSSISSSVLSGIDSDEFVLNVRKVVGFVHLVDFLGWDLKLSPLVNFKSQVFSNYISVGIANGDDSSFLDNIELLVLGP